MSVEDLRQRRVIDSVYKDNKHVGREGEFAAAVIGKLKGAGHDSYLVGGCVRDLLLGTEPKDYDITTAAHPDAVKALFPKALLVGAQFGVMLVREDGVQVEVATFRSDHEYVDGRHPVSVRFETSVREDVLRRDFTINALLLDPESGQVTDYVDGQADLRAGIVRAIGNPITRFQEDHLRLLRAVRFAARLNFEIEPETFVAIRQSVPLVLKVAAERVRDELSAMLTSANPRRAFELLDRVGLLAVLLPEVKEMQGVEQPPEFHPEGDVWIHTMIMLDGLEHPSLTLALGVLLHDVGKPATFERAADRIRFNGHVEKGVEIARAMLNRLRYSNEQTEQVLALVANHMKFKDAMRMKESTLKRFLRVNDFEEHMALHRLDCLSSHGSLANYDWIHGKLANLPAAILKPEPLISGSDLIQAGYQPGPAFKRILQVVEEAQLNGEISNRDDAMSLVQRISEL